MIEEDFSPTRWRKKPVVIDAVRLTYENVEQVAEWCEASSWDLWGLTINTIEGLMDAHCAEEPWIVKGVQGEFYPVKADIFAATYEEA
ncbi:MAG TPA: hypothetical protein VG074_13070 [Acidimicrobiales bacterium]|jgi:hypothetical protein|nr:hypothetical protein [Acidimicrobiales bacterium]